MKQAYILIVIGIALIFSAVTKHYSNHQSEFESDFLSNDVFIQNKSQMKIKSATLIGLSRQKKIQENINDQIKINGWIAKIQNSDKPESFLETALIENSQPDAAAYKLMLLEKVLSLNRHDRGMQNMAIHEMTSNVVPLEDILGDSHERTLADNMRLIVDASYKIYLNTAPGPGQAIQETNRVLAFQTDPAVRRMILYSCLQKYPELHGYFAEE